MADMNIMQGLIESLSQRPQDAIAQQGALLSNLMAQPGRMAAYLLPQQMANIEGAARGLFGIPAPVSPQQRLQEAIAANPSLLNTAEGLTQLAKLSEQSGDRANALRFSVMAAQAQQAQTQQNTALTAQRQTRTGLLNLVRGSQLPETQKIALGTAVMAGNFDGKADKLLDVTFPNKEAGDRFRTVGNYVWDNSTGSWAPGAGPKDVAATPVAAAAPSIQALPGIDFDQYDPSSFSSADAAFAKAQTPEEKQAALALLKPKLEAGEEWRTVRGVTVPFPVSGAPRREAESAVTAYNQSKQNVMRKSDTVIGAIDKVLNGIAKGETDTGVGAALGYVPGTTWWDQRMNVETIRANLGFGELQSLRAAASNGASGLGSLTEKELARLEALAGNLSLASTQEQFVSVLNQIREFYAGVKTQYSTLGDMTIEQYAGAPKATQQTLTTPSGRTYTIEEQ